LLREIAAGAQKELEIPLLVRFKKDVAETDLSTKEKDFE
jgi:hypothetical protein